MARPLPGTAEVEGREFVYIEVTPGGSFPHLMQGILASCPAESLPQSGGVLEEKVRVTLPDKTFLLAISFKGDLQVWRNKIVCYCKEKGRKWAVLKSQVFVISEGVEVPVTDCDVRFEG